MPYRLTFLSAVFGATVLAGCATIYQENEVVAELKPTSGSTVSGKILFSQHTHGMVKVSGHVSGLKPNSEHGFHIHEKGDCSSADGSSAGGHFNPNDQPHGQHSKGAHHVGDLPSLRANANGVAVVHFETPSISVGTGENANSSTPSNNVQINDVAGRSLIVHAEPDDYQSQPTGNAGARLACAVLQKPAQ